MVPLLALFAAASLGAPANVDWPQWRGPDSTGKIPAGSVLVKALPAQPRVIWSVPVGAGHASPVVSRGAVYYLDAQNGKETAHRVDAGTGKELWQTAVDDLFADQQGTPGPRCAPTVDGDRLYAQSCRGEFQCLDVRTGKVIWRTNFVRDLGAPMPAEAGTASGGSRHGYSGPPFIDGNHIIAGVGGPNGAGIVCFDKRTGAVIWKSQNDPPGHLGPIVATVAGVKQVLDFTADGLIGVDLTDGSLLWRVPIKTRFGRHSVTPVIVGDTVVVGSFTTGLTGVRVTRSAAGLSAAQAWNISSAGTNFSSPVAIGKLVYGLGPGSRLFCVDPAAGREVWAEDGFFSGMVTSGWAAFMVSGQDLLVHTESGQIVLARVDAKGGVIAGKAQICGTNWCHPAYVNGRVFVRDAKELRCVQLAP